MADNPMRSFESIQQGVSKDPEVRRIAGQDRIAPKGFARNDPSYNIPPLTSSFDNAVPRSSKEAIKEARRKFVKEHGRFTLFLSDFNGNKAEESKDHEYSF